MAKKVELGRIYTDRWGDLKIPFSSYQDNYNVDTVKKTFERVSVHYLLKRKGEKSWYYRPDNYNVSENQFLLKNQPTNVLVDVKALNDLSRVAAEFFISYFKNLEEVSDRINKILK